MAPMSEVAIVPIVDGIDVYDQTTEAGMILAETVRLTAEQPGFQRMIWGLRTDRKEMVMIVNWDDPQFHRNFMNAPFYGQLMDRFNTIVGGPLILFHAVFTQGLGFNQELGLAPLIELGKFTADLALIYLPLGPATSQLEPRIFQATGSALGNLRESGKARYTIAGWSLGDALIEGDRPGKGPEKSFVAMVTWKNSDERERTVRSDRSFLGNVPALVDGYGELDEFSVEFQPVVTRAQ